MTKQQFAIVTTDLPATKNRDHQIRAFGGGHTVTVDYDPSSTEQNNHIRAGVAVARYHGVKPLQTTEVTRPHQRTKTARGIVAKVDLTL